MAGSLRRSAAALVVTALSEPAQVHLDAARLLSRVGAEKAVLFLFGNVNECRKGLHGSRVLVEGAESARGFGWEEPLAVVYPLDFLRSRHGLVQLEEEEF